jgi:DNA polymerase-3 subunit alpha
MKNLKELNVDVLRPDINECFADFRTVDNKFYYALGGIKAVGYEAISNIVKERIKMENFNL